jgi:hypothetical protein
MTLAATGEEQTIILLGASNVSLGWRPLIQSVQARRTGPLHILTAHGMGRSYITTSRFGWRTAPGILESQLWQTLRAGEVRPPSAVLITDVGNDLVYGRSTREMIAAVEEVILRLRQSSPDCSIVVTRPPLRSVESLSSLRYQLFRTAIFPFCKLSLNEAVEGTQELDRKIQALTDVHIVNTNRDWFGLDPIHIRKSCRAEAFQAFVALWPVDAHNHCGTTPGVPGRPRMCSRSVLGWQLTTPQPSAGTAQCLVSAW